MNKKTKHTLIVVIIFVSFLTFLILINNLLQFDNKILKGYYKSDIYKDPHRFMDYIDFYKYYYTANDDYLFQNSKFYNKVKPDDIEKLKSFFINFGDWMEAENRSLEYNFDLSIIDENDYFIIYTKSNLDNNSNYGNFDYYNVYFYDIDSHILYEIYCC